MTLKEFSETYLTLPKAVMLNNGWRRVYPTRIRHAKMKNEVRNFLFPNEPAVWEIQEKWERVHKGEIIDTQWRAIEEAHFAWED